MSFPTATFIISVNEKFKPYLQVLKNNLNKTGVRYELYIISELCGYDYSELKPKKVFEINQENSGVEIVNFILPNVLTPYVFFIQEPFLCEKDWSKKNIEFTDQILNIGVSIIASTDSIGQLHYTHALNKDFALQDVFQMNNHTYFGMYLIKFSTIQILGGFNANLSLEEAIVEYCVRCEKMGMNNYSPLNLITSLSSRKKVTIETKDVVNLQLPFKSFSAIEELAYISLENLLFELKITATRFMFEFTGTFGFRCECLNQEIMKKIDWFCIKFDLNYEIKSKFLSKEQLLRDNVWVIFKSKR